MDDMMFLTFLATLAGAAWRLLTDTYEECAAELGRRWLTVRYEDLVADPKAQITRVLDHIGLPWNDAFESGLGRYAFSPARLTAYRDELSPAQITDIEKVIGDNLERYGYDRVSTPGDE